MEYEYLKDLFGDGSLSFTQFVEKLGAADKVKLVNLKDGGYVGKEKFDTLQTERDGLKTQLETANTTIQSYKDMDIEGIKQSAADWESKYNTDTQALRDKISGMEYDHTVESAVAGMKFTSMAAKKAFVSDLTAKKLTVQDGKLLGLDDFVKTYKEADPSAFASETPPPQFTKPGTPQMRTTNGQAEVDAFYANNPFYHKD
ncbi:MAG: phage scaffolding protein [Clostridiaceae bacterium]|nr:phage scaffolding protein [Clostridiaceae bacterium]